MKSKWKVTSNSINGEIMYGVYRTVDTGKPDHSGNREMAGGYTVDREAAQIVADLLNKKEEEMAL